MIMRVFQSHHGFRHRRHIDRRLKLNLQCIEQRIGDPIDVAADAPAMARFLGLIGRDPNR